MAVTSGGQLNRAFTQIVESGKAQLPSISGAVKKAAAEPRGMAASIAELLRLPRSPKISPAEALEEIFAVSSLTGIPRIPIVNFPAREQVAGI
jgi:hypothetical protein